MSDRPDLHTDRHDDWDQGGYCNNLVVDHDGTGTTCGYRNGSTARIAEMIERSSLGTPSARALRDTISDERAAAIVARAAALGGAE